MARHGAAFWPFRAVGATGVPCGRTSCASGRSGAVPPGLACHSGTWLLVRRPAPRRRAIRQRPPPSRRSHPDDSPQRTIAAAPRRTRHPAHPPVGHRPCPSGHRVPGRGARRPGRPPAPARRSRHRPGPAAAPAVPTAAAHLPLWAVVTIVAATAVLSVATILITLTLEHRYRARRTPAAAPGAPTRPATAEPPPGRARSLPATSTWPATTCTGPTAGKGPVARRQPSGVILNGCRTASPSATWRTDPHTRHSRAPHRHPCHMATTPGRDQDAVMVFRPATGVSRSATPGAPT
jgi:hypothetical protein